MPAPSFDTQALLEGCCFFGSYEAWERGRRALGRYLGGARHVMDLGCANGFVLHCLREWTNNLFVPFGVDVHEGRIEAARALFPEHAGNFTCANFAGMQWAARPYDVVMIPWFEWMHTGNFLGEVHAYLDRCPDTTAIFTLYDGEMQLWDGMATACHARFGDIKPVTRVGDVLGVVCAGRSPDHSVA